MTKKCKHCGEVVETAVSICPKCQNFAFVEIPKVELSHEQFQELVKSATDKLQTSSSLAWRLTWRVALVIFAILGIPGAIVGWGIWGSMQGFEQTTTTNIQARFTLLSQVSSNQIAQAHSAISNDVASKFEMFREEASNQLALAYSSVTNQIAEEFQTPRIKQTVEAVAKGEAKSILEAEVQPAVKSFKDDALFIRTIARAQGYDFKAYQSLLEIGNGTNDNAQIANQTIAEIDRSLARDRSDFSPKRHLTKFLGTNVYEGPFTSDELATDFSAIANDRTSFNREGFINTVGDMKQPFFLARLIEFFTNETDLAVADRTTIAISDLVKEDFHPHDFEQIMTWWHSHQNGYTNWPIAEFNNGLNDIAVGNYSHGFQSFQKVLEIDTLADKSRALAILCGSEIGDTNKVEELTKGFKQPDARWAQWAAAIAELQNGSVSNATVRFAALKKKQPTMIFLPDKQIPFWRNIDWQLFHKLISAQ